MRRPSPLPDHLVGRPFTVAEASAAGLSEMRLRASDLEAPFPGLRVPRGSASTVAGRARALATALPERTVFSHLTAARLWPLELPAEGPGELLHVAVPHPERAPRRGGVVGHALRDPDVRVIRRWGLRVTDGATLFCHLAATLEHEDLVAVGDALVRVPRSSDDTDPRPWLRLDDLRSRVERFAAPGNRAARRAVACVRLGAESRRETQLRLVLVAAKLPEPAVNVEIHDARGLFIGRVDLYFREYRVIVEYEGDHHRTDRAQWNRDLIRYERLAAAGYAVVRIAAAAFTHDPGGCAERVRSRLRASGWRPTV